MHDTCRLYEMMKGWYGMPGRYDFHNGRKKYRLHIAENYFAISEGRDFVAYEYHSSEVLESTNKRKEKAFLTAFRKYITSFENIDVGAFLDAMCDKVRLKEKQMRLEKLNSERQILMDELTLITDEGRYTLPIRELEGIPIKFSTTVFEVMCDELRYVEGITAETLAIMYNMAYPEDEYGTFWLYPDGTLIAFSGIIAYHHKIADILLYKGAPVYENIPVTDAYRAAHPEYTYTTIELFEKVYNYIVPKERT